MERILEQIENVKEKLSSEEYKNLMESLASVHQKLKDEVIIEVFYSKIDVILSAGNFVNVHPDNGFIKLKQTGIPINPHHAHNHEDLLNGKFHKRRVGCFIDLLSKENREIFFRLRECNIHDTSGDNNIDICFDDSQWIHFRIIKKNVPVPILAPPEEDSDSEEES